MCRTAFLVEKEIEQKLGDSTVINYNVKDLKYIYIDIYIYI